MRGKCLLSAAVVVAVLVPAGADDKNKDKLDPAKIVGTWTLVSGERDGKKVEDDNLKKTTVIITKETITLKGDDGSFVIKYKLDAKKDLATLGMEITEGPAGVGTKTGGILALKGEELKLCYAAMGGDPPKEFTGKEGSGNHYFVMKKKK